MRELIRGGYGLLRSDSQGGEIRYMTWELDGEAYRLAAARGAPVAYQPTSEDAVTPQFVETTPETLDQVLREGGFTLVAVRTVDGGPSNHLGIFENAEGQQALIGLTSV